MGRVVVAVLGAVALLTSTAGCAAQAGRVSAGPSSAPVGHPAGSTSPGTAGKSPAEHVDLAPAGPAPAGPGDEDESDRYPVASALALKVGCEDLESQAHLPSVAEQLSCRLGVQHVYVMTFRQPADRDAYLSGLQVITGGYNVVGPTWVLHMEDPTSASAVTRQLGGTVRPGA